MIRRTLRIMSASSRIGNRNALAIAERNMRQIDRAIRAFDRLSIDKIVTSLSRFRNKVLAHKNTGQVQHGLKYGYPSQLLRRSFAIFDDMAHPIDGTRYSFQGLEKAWRKYASEFWLRAVHGPKHRIARR
jgi:hypothetical protein